MSLSRDERRLLAGYFVNLRKPEHTVPYEKEQLGLMLDRSTVQQQKVFSYWDEKPKSADSYEKSDTAEEKRAWVDRQVEVEKKYKDHYERVDTANQVLAHKGLIDLTPHESLHYVVVVGLTFQGFELARQLATRSGYSYLWFQTHKEWLLAFCSLPFLGWFFHWLFDKPEPDSEESKEKPTPTATK